VTVKHHIRSAALLLLLALLAALIGCTGQSAPAPQQDSEYIFFETSEPQSGEGAETAEQASEPAPAQTDAPSPQPQQAENDAFMPDEDGYYYAVEEVVLYLHYYGRLPGNYISKNEARKLGWEGGSVEKFREGAAIGGDRFGNYEGLLPEKDGRGYTECDIGTEGKNGRGAERLIFSDDGLYFYTTDHYESFTELYVTPEGEVVRK
jgi:hypothetical protein